ncbi:MAG: hypothetical protein OQK95_12045 [Gammaproteobacteria bacterium]|nr:hypothetical protein [Gammaproteobacteria bacterium]MCW9030681.1 hypothetical protein [Gammaproteobacteria bacterium]
MDENKQKELAVINKKIFKTKMYGYPGGVFLGFGLYGIFGANGDAFHPVLNDSEIVYSLTIIGAIIIVWELSALMPLFKKKSKITNE